MPFGLSGEFVEQRGLPVNARMESFAHSSSSLARSLLFKGRYLVMVLLVCFGSAAFGQVLDVTKTDGVGVGDYTPGQSLTYEITVTNMSGVTTSGVVLTDVMSPLFARYDYNTTFLGGATLASGPPAGSGTSGSGSPGTITFNVNLPVGGVVTITVQAIVRSSAFIGAPAVLNNTITASGGTPPVSGTTQFTDSNTRNGFPPTGYNMPLCSATGSDGAITASTSGQIINTYYAPPVATTTLPANSRCLPVDTTIGTGGAFGDTSIILDAGDKLLVIQMQDGTLSTADTAAYGGTGSGRGFTARGFAGNYEYVQVDGGIGSLVHGCGAGQIPITGASG